MHMTQGSYSDIFIDDFEQMEQIEQISPTLAKFHQYQKESISDIGHQSKFMMCLL